MLPWCWLRISLAMESPRPVPPEFPASGLIHAVKPLKEPGQILFGYADAVVGDGDIDLLALGAGGDVDFAAVGGVFDGVGDDVHDDLLDALPVAVDAGEILRALEGQGVAVVLGVQRHGLVDVLHGLGEGKRVRFISILP